MLGQALLGRCTTYSSDLKVRGEATGLSTFPDVSVVCGDLAPSPIDALAITNPSILVEVTSPSTEDRGDKLSHYKQVPSLRAVLFVSHQTPRVTLVERVAGGWQEREFRGGERVELLEPALRFEIDELYRGITLDA